MNLIESDARDMLYFLPCRSVGVFRGGGKSGGWTIGSVREVGLSQSRVVLAVFGSTSVFALVKFA